jgi:type VI secretion system protein ImpF
MARRDAEQNVTQSGLERLIDREIGTPTDSSITYAQSVRQLKLSLRRDLEWLLNSRQTPEPAEKTFQELHRSLYNYGLPDVTSISHETFGDRARLLQLVEATIEMFEPRLTRVKVTPLEALRGAVHVLRFQIEGMLMMDPEPEHISFDTVLQLASGQYDVRGGDAGAG